MLTIRKQQIEAMERIPLEDFIDRMVNHLQEDFSVEIKDKDIQKKELRPLVSEAIDIAEHYGIIYESDLRLFIECIALLGPNFDRTNKFPKVNDILNRLDLNGEKKMDKISEFLTFEL